jgi:hypothetical protein
MWIDLLILSYFLWIAYYDCRFHLIRNIDLILLLLIQSFVYLGNFLIALSAISIYLLLNLLAKGKIGAGDVKLSFFCATPLGSLSEILNSISIAWIAGGLFALTRRPQAIPFAPFMIFATYMVKIL